MTVEQILKQIAKNFEVTDYTQIDVKTWKSIQKKSMKHIVPLDETINLENDQDYIKFYEFLNSLFAGKVYKPTAFKILNNAYFKKERKFNNRIKLASIVLVIPLVVSILQTGYPIIKDFIDSKEVITITTQSITYEHTSYYTQYFDGTGFLDGVVYTIVLSNNSKETVSLINYDLRTNGTPSIKYPKIVQDMWTRDEKLSLPIILPPGEATTLSINVNTLIPKEVNELLEAEFSYNTRITFESIAKVLDVEKYDIYGNTIDVSTFEDGSRLVVIEKPIFPEYYFQITTGRKNIFSHILTKTPLY